MTVEAKTSLKKSLDSFSFDMLKSGLKRKHKNQKKNVIKKHGQFWDKQSVALLGTMDNVKFKQPVRFREMIFFCKLSFGLKMSKLMSKCGENISDLLA